MSKYSYGNTFNYSYIKNAGENAEGGFHMTDTEGLNIDSYAEGKDFMDVMKQLINDLSEQFEEDLEDKTEKDDFVKLLSKENQDLYTQLQEAWNDIDRLEKENARLKDDIDEYNDILIDAYQLIKNL